MCAIAGILDLSADSVTIESMLKTMKRRGPDENGMFTGEDCILLHSRLSVIDPVGGKQPMVLQWNGEEYTIVYNGELYNTEEVRKELIRAGHCFTTHSDTEVVLHAYSEYGENALGRFNGIFSFAIWEKKRKRLFLARDRMGVKPLFYMNHRGGFLFASEIKTILRYPSVKARLTYQGVAELILIGPGRTPGYCALDGICEVKPGTYGYWEKGRFSVFQYWKLRDREHRESFEETAEHVRFLVTDAIRRQMVSDVPIGTFLSGGLDSSIISSVCSRVCAEHGEKLRTFSVDYQNNDIYFRGGKFQPESDASYIDLMKNYLGTNHTSISLSSDELCACMLPATLARDLPGMADVDFSLLAFCKKIREKVTVALSGECADEIFGGYPWYRDPDVRAIDGFPWAQNTAQRADILLPETRKVLDPEAYVRNRYKETIESADILPGTSPLETRMKQMMNLNLCWFMQTLLDRKDRMSMYHGLEVRVPFCDYRIVEYLYGVPWSYKEYEGREKGLLRYAMRDYLPQDVLYRKKSPYPKTYDPEYEAGMEKLIYGTLKNPSSPLLQVISGPKLLSMLQSESPWPWYGQLMRRPQIMAYFLQLDLWLRSYNVEIAI